MPDTAKWAAYDVARNRLLIQIGEYDYLIDQEQAAAVPNLVRIATLESEQNALIDQSNLLSPEPVHFIEVGDFDDLPKPLPLFVTKQRENKE